MTDGWPRRVSQIDPLLYLQRYGLAALAFVPALTLSAFWFGPKGLLMVGALTIPGILIVTGGLRFSLSSAEKPARGRQDQDKAALLAALDHGLSLPDGVRTAAIVAAIDEVEEILEQYGDGAVEDALAQCEARFDASLRQGDILTRHTDSGFAIAVAPGRRLDLEAMVQLSARLQRALADPITVGAHGLQLTVSVGFCLPRRDQAKSATACLEAAEAALAEAQVYGPGAIRAYVPSRAQRPAAHPDMAQNLSAAFDAGQIVPWFQPQLCTDTGEVSGMEALARWEHPVQGVIPPVQFLPVVAAQGLEQRLTEAILAGAFEALQIWDDAGYRIESVGVNFAGADLADPMLADRIRWELDRLSLDPERLTIEVLETVIAEGTDDAVTRSIQRLAALGCRIDLDDFGSGHAAIGNIRRFSVGRIKIDRSFVTRIDIDPDQQTMVTAILEMAQRLGLETLAEGVESVGEHTLLAQLGCNHVQGFSIARPMPFGETMPWLARHRDKIADVAWPTRRAG